MFWNAQVFHPAFSLTFRSYFAALHIAFRPQRRFRPLERDAIAAANGEGCRVSLGRLAAVGHFPHHRATSA